jgi:hypothetical protein
VNTTKKTAFGIAGAAAATLLTVGFAAPAMADTSSDSSTTESMSSWSSVTDLTNDLTTALSTGDLFTTPVVIAPNVDTGDLSVGDVASGNQAPIASGNEVAAPVASGNETSVTAPVASGNETGNGNSVANPTTDTSVGDLTSNIGTEVQDLVGGVTGGLGLGLSD